jgi:DNA-binding response OmpR family regulator
MDRTTPKLTCVLMVSRDERACGDVVSWLQRRDCVVWCADTLGVALEHMAQLLPDVLLLDAHLPEDVAGFLERLRQDRDLQRVPVVLLGHDPAEVDEGAARELGARSVLAFPIQTEVLRRHVDAAAAEHARAELRQVMRAE